MEKTQVANNEKFDSIQTDVSKIKGSLKQTHKIAVGYCGALQSFSNFCYAGRHLLPPYGFGRCSGI
jgi:hypothetical protein